jgi:hypothetical protein
VLALCLAGSVLGGLALSVSFSGAPAAYAIAGAAVAVALSAGTWLERRAPRSNQADG